MQQLGNKTKFALIAPKLLGRSPYPLLAAADPRPWWPDAEQEGFMRRRRLLSTVLAAALVAAGLSPGAAHAAGGPNLAQGKPATSASSTSPYAASNVSDGNASSYWESANN